MYLDHRITVKIARILDMIDLSALLLDFNGNVILPEGDSRTLTMPKELLQKNADRAIRIPMGESQRSLNLSNSVAIVLYEALRQNNFLDLV